MYRFRLEFLLRYRQQKEETAMHELARCIRAANDVESELEANRQRALELAESLKGTVGQTMPASVFGLYMNHQENIKRHDAVLKEQLKAAEKKINEQRQVLVSASQDHQMLDRLKEKQKESYRAEESKREQEALEELGAIARQRAKNTR